MGNAFGNAVAVAAFVVTGAWVVTLIWAVFKVVTWLTG